MPNKMKNMGEKTAVEPGKMQKQQDNFQALAHEHLNSIMNRAAIPQSTQESLRNQFYVYSSSIPNIPKDAKKAVTEFLDNYAKMEGSHQTSVARAQSEMRLEERHATRAGFDNANFNYQYQQTQAPTLGNRVSEGLKTNAQRQEAAQKAIEEAQARAAKAKENESVVTGPGQMASVAPSETERPTVAVIGISTVYDPSKPAGSKARTSDLQISYSFYRQTDDQGNAVLVACPNSMAQTRAGLDTSHRSGESYRDTRTMGPGEFNPGAAVSGPIEISYNDNKYLLYIPASLGITPENYNANPQNREFVDNFMQQINNKSISAKPLPKTS